MTKLIALLALCPLAFAACGSDNDPAAKGPDDSDAARVKFEQCLRDNGVNVESAQSGNGPTKITTKVGKGPAPNRFARIQDDCRKKSGFKPQPPSQEEQEEMRDAALKFARCMRSNGINMPDPKVGPGGGMLQRGPSGVNPESPRFQAAEQECQKLLPKMGGPGGAEVGTTKP